MKQCFHHHGNTALLSTILKENSFFFFFIQAILGEVFFAHTIIRCHGRFDQSSSH